MISIKNKITILGQKWKIVFKNMRDADGRCQPGIKEIWIANDINEKAASVNRVIRHEIIHAFMFESGLGYNFEWDKAEETMVDWVAIQYPKLKAVYEELGIEN